MTRITIPLSLAKALAAVTAAVPAIIIIATLFGDDPPPEPVEFLQDETGLWALRLLLVTLALSPLQKLTRWRFAIPIRRPIGVATFFYASVHAASFLVFDQLLDPAAILTETLERPSILLGMTAWLLLIPMALSSNSFAVRRLGFARWKALHRASYLVTVLVCLHFFMLVKVDLSSPILYSALALALLLWRIWTRSHLR
ncbi:MAG: sulfite oxidase heme-binding subunit YedZ [Burkholderiaceae bacterium]